jgi:hypothetical protein
LKANIRPNLDLWLGNLLQAFVRANPNDLAHIRPENILFVAGAARRTHRASIRPLRFDKDVNPAQWQKPVVTFNGHDILYEICLRPLFFLEGNFETRIRTIGHELWHISKAFDGCLEESRRHEKLDSRIVEHATEALYETLQPLNADIRNVFSREGELLLSAWKIRPPSRIPMTSQEQLHFSEEDLFESVIVQRNKPQAIKTQTAP